MSIKIERDSAVEMVKLFPFQKQSINEYPIKLTCRIKEKSGSSDVICPRAFAVNSSEDRIRRIQVGNVTCFNCSVRTDRL